MFRNKTLLLFFIFIGLSTNFLIANELDKLSGEKKYEVSICAIFKNEALYLKDWIDYHLNRGVDHFYLYNIGSTDYYEKVLKSYIKNNIVTLVNWPEALPYKDDHALKWALSTQIPAYENAANFLARDETQWLVFLDINEFLMLPEENIKEKLNQYSEYPGIALHSEFSDKEPIKAFNVKNLHNETLEIKDFPLEIIDKAVAKIIFKPDHCLGFNWPPYQCRFKESGSCFEVDPNEFRVRRCINRYGVQNSYEKTRKLREDDILPAPYEKINEKCYKPMYCCLPDFLRKLKNSKSNETETLLLDPF